MRALPPASSSAHTSVPSLLARTWRTQLPRSAEEHAGRGSSKAFFERVYKIASLVSASLPLPIRLSLSVCTTARINAGKTPQRDKRPVDILSLHLIWVRMGVCLLHKCPWPLTTTTTYVCRTPSPCHHATAPCQKQRSTPRPRKKVQRYISFVFPDCVFGTRKRKET